MLNGSLGIAAGGAFIVVGVLIDSPLVTSMLAVTGGASVGRGLLALTVLPNASGPAARFNAMPMGDAGQIAARIAYGERALDELARRSRRARLLDGSLSIAAGAAYIPTYLLLRARDTPRYRFGDDAVDYIAVGLSAVSAASGILTLVRPSAAERRKHSYERMRATFVSLRPDIRWNPNGIVVGARGLF